MVSICLGLWLALLMAGDTPIGRSMRRWLVDWPATRLARIKRGAAITWLILGAIGATCFWVLEDEGLRLFTMVLPELAGWLTAFEVASLVDALAVTVMAVSTLRVGAVRAWLAHRLPSRRARRTRRVRGVMRASNDDEDRGLKLAA